MQGSSFLPIVPTVNEKLWLIFHQLRSHSMIIVWTRAATVFEMLPLIQIRCEQFDTLIATVLIKYHHSLHIFNLNAAMIEGLGVVALMLMPSWVNWGLQLLPLLSNISFPLHYFVSLVQLLLVTDHEVVLQVRCWQGEIRDLALIALGVVQNNFILPPDYPFIAELVYPIGNAKKGMNIE